MRIAAVDIFRGMTIMKMELLASAMRPVIAALSLAFLPTVASADTINFLDSGESVSATINGAVITGNGGRVSDFSSIGESISFDLSLASGDFITVSGFTDLLEPGSRSVSDRFVYSFTSGALAYHVEFGSDPDLPAIPTNAIDFTTIPEQGLPPNPYFENGRLQLVATAFLGSSTDRFFVQSDATPLPAALPLFATGLGAFGLFGWRRKRKGAAEVAA
jgi:hypothetical protein